MKFSQHTAVIVILLMLLTCITIVKAKNDYNLELDSTTVTVTTDKSEYLLRETVTVEGTVATDSSPASDLLVAMKIKDPRNFNVAFRTATVGSPNETWLLEVKEIFLQELDFDYIDTVKTGEQVLFGATVWNRQIHSISNIYVTLTICEASGIVIDSVVLYQGSIAPHSNLSAATTVYIPLWATPGAAKIYCNVYDKELEEAGIPFLPETVGEYHISRSEQGKFYGGCPLSNGTSYPPGIYGTSIKLSPEPYPGSYQIHAVARYTPVIRTMNTTSFEVLDSPSPPQASFTYQPLNPYPNQTVTFDASSSSAEGYGDVIVRYEWNFGDESPPVVNEGTPSDPPDPTVTHEYFSWETFIVTLNVTDAEGYWSTTQKPITIKSPYPTANFTWSPHTGWLNRTITFDASNSLPGWSIPQAAEAPIVNYTWNFGDGNITSTTEPTIGHKYLNPGNYTVMLTVTDSENQQDSISYLIEVVNMTYPPYDINQDGQVDIEDVATVAVHFGEFEGDPNWDPLADINEDGKVDIEDVAIVASHFGEIF